jgi:excisionase family DNA binding protein
MPVLDDPGRTLADAPDALTVREVAQLLRLSESATYELVRRGGIAAVHFGRSIRIPKAAVMRLLGPEVSPSVREAQP